jgi:hypothetical protein
MGRTIVKVHSGKKVTEIAVDQMRLNGGLKVRDLGFKPPTGNRACPSRDEAFVEMHASVRLNSRNCSAENSAAKRLRCVLGMLSS